MLIKNSIKGHNFSGKHRTVKKDGIVNAKRQVGMIRGSGVRRKTDSRATSGALQRDLIGGEIRSSKVPDENSLNELLDDQLKKQVLTS